MNSYANQTKLKNERIIISSYPHPIIFSIPVLFLFCSLLLWLFGNYITLMQLNFSGYSLAGIISFVLAIFGLLNLIKAFATYKTSEYTVTNKRVIMKTGVLQTNALELMITRIEAVHVMQTVTGRVFNFGNVVLIGVGGTKDYFFYIPDPYHFRQCIQELRSQEMGNL